MKFINLFDMIWGNISGRIIVTDKEGKYICIGDLLEIEKRKDLFGKKVLAVGTAFDPGARSGARGMFEEWNDFARSVEECSMFIIKIDASRNEVKCDPEETFRCFRDEREYDRLAKNTALNMMACAADLLVHRGE